MIKEAEEKVCNCKEPELDINFSICCKCNGQVAHEVWVKKFGDLVWDDKTLTYIKRKK